MVVTLWSLLYSTPAATQVSPTTNKAKGGDLKLLCPCDRVLEAFKVLHLLEIIPNFEDETQALAAVPSRLSPHPQALSRIGWRRDYYQPQGPKDGELRYKAISVDILDVLKKFFLSIIFLASKSSLTVSPYQLIFPENLPFRSLLSWRNNSVWVSSLSCNADRIARLSDS